MTPTAATRARANKPKPAPEPEEEVATDQDKDLTDVVDDKGKRLTVQQLKNKLRNEAEREVLDAHRPEVISRTAAKYKDHNLEYVRRLSEEEKAAKQIEELYAKFPQLRPQLEQQQAQQELVDDTVPPVVTYVEAVPGGALDTFRTEYPEEGELPEPGAHYEEEYADVEPGE